MRSMNVVVEDNKSFLILTLLGRVFKYIWKPALLRLILIGVRSVLLLAARVCNAFKRANSESQSRTQPTVTKKTTYISARAQANA
jgi:hypothetical protein